MVKSHGQKNWLHNSSTHNSGQITRLKVAIHKKKKKTIQFLNEFLCISSLDVLLNSPLASWENTKHLEEEPSSFSEVTRTDGINLKINFYKVVYEVKAK